MDTNTEVKDKDLDETKEVKHKEGAKNSNLIKGIAIGAVMAALAIAIALFVVNNNQKAHTPKVENAAGILVTGKEADKSLELVNTAMANLRSKNIIINVQDSASSYITIVYNNKGEAIAEAPDTGYKTVYMKDHKTVQFSDALGYGYDSEVLTLMESVLNMAKTDNLPVLISTEENEATEDGIEYKEILVDVQGWDKIQKLYSTIDAEFGQIMTDNLKDSLETASQTEGSTISSTDALNFRFVYLVDTSGKLHTGACYLYFGDKPSDEVTWDDLSYSWIFEDYIEVYDWSLADAWYTTEWNNMLEWTDTTEVEELLGNQYKELVDMLNKFAVDNGGEPIVNDIGTSDIQNFEPIEDGNNTEPEVTNPSPEVGNTTPVDNTTPEVQDSDSE